MWPWWYLVGGAMISLAEHPHVELLLLLVVGGELGLCQLQVPLDVGVSMEQRGKSGQDTV